MARKVRWEEMFWDELESAFTECPLVYFVYGLCEPHGPHNAVGLDGLKAHAIACRAAEASGGIVAPLDLWHIHETGGMAVWADQTIGQPPRHWLTSLPPWQHFKNVCYHIRAADAIGFHAAILFTGHYGPNWEDLKTLVSLIQPQVGVRLYALPEFESNYKGFDGDGQRTGDHAGKVETSLLWALRPELVDTSRLAPVGQYPFAQGPDAREADRHIGERMVLDEIEWLGSKGRELLAEYDRLQPQHTFTTFEQVEAVWDALIEPAVAGFETMKPRWQDPHEVEPSSMWYANMKVPKNWRK